jgi:RNA polymerase sigma-70 factor, ECF subfamily
MDVAARQEWDALQEQDRLARFELLVVPHMAAAYNLVRWLTRNDHDAEDMVQEAYLRAFRFFNGFRGGDSRAWLLAIVRNTCYTWLDQNRHPQSDQRDLAESMSDDPGPETLMLERIDRDMLHRAIELLPAEFREIIVLREMEDLSYKEIAAVTGVPIGTVMSRLARARSRLQQALSNQRSVGGAV